MSYRIETSGGKNLGVLNSRSINESGHCQNNWVKHVWDKNKATRKKALGRRSGGNNISATQECFRNGKSRPIMNIS
jgi:hypothetical protein